MWKDRFEKKILDRGYRYYFLKKVELLKEKDEIIEFKVRGTKEYTVIIDKYNRKSSCNCPYALGGKNCKHMVASIYEYNTSGDKRISKYDLEESKWIIENILEIWNVEESTAKFMEFLDDVKENIYNDFNSLAENILIFSFVEFAFHVDKYKINDLIMVTSKIMKLLRLSLEDRKYNLQVKILYKLYNKIKKIYIKNPIVLLFYLHLEKTFINCRKEIKTILLENVNRNEDMFLELLFDLYSKFHYDDDLLKLAEKFSDKEISYKYLVEMEERKENYSKVIEYCEKALKICEDSSYFIEYILKITRNVDKYFDKFYKYVLLKFENNREILYEDYSIICEKLSKDKLEDFKKNILDNHLKIGEYIKILFHEKMYEKILKQVLNNIFAFDYIAKYMIENYGDILYSKICNEIIQLVKNSNSISDYENIANVVDYINKFKDGNERRAKFEKELFEMFPNKKRLKKILSYV